MTGQLQKAGTATKKGAEGMGYGLGVATVLYFVLKYRWEVILTPDEVVMFMTGVPALVTALLTTVTMGTRAYGEWRIRVIKAQHGDFDGDGKRDAP